MTARDTPNHPDGTRAQESPQAQGCSQVDNISLAQDYAKLLPDTVIQAVESQGFLCDARILALNSYENRVYQVGIEIPLTDKDETHPRPPPLIAKFYRPNRWSDEQILEEHQFTLELRALDIPVVPPLVLTENEHSSTDIADSTLFRFGGYRFSLFPRHGGRPPELSNQDNLYWLGRYIGRIHSVGKTVQFLFRPTLTLDSFVINPSRFILANNFIPVEFTRSYASIISDLLKHLEVNYQAENFNFIRLHGDCHPGNILWTDRGPHFVDFDDCRTGPAIQDLWMLLSGNEEEQQLQLTQILKGYEEFCHFDYREIQLLEVLRTMRMIHYTGWIAKRWNDPAFPLAFPWFNTAKYWGEHILDLKVQLAALQEPGVRFQSIL